MAVQNDQLNILIMAGGSGTRFWPKSRAKKPKQLLKLWDDQTLLEHTIRRFLKIVKPENIWIVTTKLIEGETKKITSKISKKIKILAEPEAKNTAACILWGSIEIQKKKKNAVIAVMAADHYISDENKFIDGIQFISTQAIKNDEIYIVGIKPNKPETGFGYIELNQKITDEKKLIDVKKFVEKPNLETAKQYLSSQKYLWNAGMFIFNVKTILNAFHACSPELFENFSSKAPIQKKYSNVQKKDATSFDYAVMEKLSYIKIPTKVLPIDCGWNDVGSFAALEEINCQIRGNQLSIDSSNNIIQSEKGLVALLGVKNLVVVKDGDVVLVADKSRCQDIKLIIEQLKQTQPKFI